MSTPVQMVDNLAVGVSEDGRAIAGQGVLDDANRTIVAVTWTCT